MCIFSDKLSKRYDGGEEFYRHLRSVEWIGEANRDNLFDVSLKPRKFVMAIFKLNDSDNNNILYSMNQSELNGQILLINYL